MDNLTTILMNSLGNGGIETMAQKAGVQKEQAASAMGAIVPVILSGMAKNASNKRGASSLLIALDKDHDGSVLDDIAGFMGNSANSGKGAGILKHVLGGNRATVENGIGQKTGMNAAQIGSMMEMAAPMIMAYLGKKKRQSPSSMNDTGIGSMLEGLTGTSGQGSGMDLGDLMNVVGSMSGKDSGRKGGLLGGLLKGVFGRR